MRLSKKLTLSFGGIVVIMLILSGFAIKSASDLNDSITEVDEIWIPSIVNVMSMSLEATRVRAFVASGIAEKNPDILRRYDELIKESLATFQKSREAYITALNAAPADSDEEDRALMKQLDELATQLGPMRGKVLEQAKAGKTDEALATYDHEYSPCYEKIRDVLVRLMKLNIDGATAVAHAGNDLGTLARNLAIGLSLAGVLVSLVLAFLLIRSVNAQLGKDPGELALLAKRVVDGHYDVDDGGKKQGVYASLVEMVTALKGHIENARRESENAQAQSAKATEAMQQAEAASREAKAKAEVMSNTALRLEEVAHVVSSASTQLAAQVAQSDRGAVESAQHLHEAATAMNEMNATVQEVARNAAAASSASAETRARAENGANIVHQSLRSIEEIHDLALALKGDMAQLNEHSQAITRIMNVISDIADQTNLLALNAAIEAARAGEAGRGFAVVADEVRKLAEKTMASTHDVGNAIEAIQQSTSKSVKAMDHAVEQIDRATSYASQSGQALKEIVSTVDATADQVQAIATASEEQSAASEEINRSLIQTNDMANQTVHAMHEAAQAVSDLAAQAQRLTGLIAEMRQSG